MKKHLLKSAMAALIVIALMLVSFPAALAAAESREYLFDLASNGEHEIHASAGDIITVTFTLYRTDSQEEADIYAMQNEICYDGDFFELVDESLQLYEGIETAKLGKRDNHRLLYMNFVSFAGGERWPD